MMPNDSHGFVLGSSKPVNHKYNYASKVKEDAVLMTGPNAYSGRKNKVKKNQQVTVHENARGWAMISYQLNNNEYLGWIESKYVDAPSKES